MTAQREQVPERADFPVHRPVPTRWSDNDHYGHVNNVMYYSFFDTAVNGWLIEATGVDIRELPAIGLVVATDCRFLAPLSFPDLVVAGLRLGRLGSTSVGYEIGLFRADARQPAGYGHFTHVYVDRQTRRPVPVPELIVTALAALRRPAAG
jgi:acyl-CoA thioester hydrolase